MKLLAYCILARRDAGLDLPDEIAGRAVRLAVDGALAAAVSEVAAGPRPGVEEVLAFEAVVEWFHTHCPAIIPVRFGPVFEDEEALSDALSRGREEYSRLLEDLKGVVEFGIRVLAGKPASVPAAGSGAAWLAARRRHYLSLDRSTAGCDSVSAQLKAELNGMFRSTRQDVAGGMLSIYFLVPRPQADAFLERARQVRLSGARVLLSGPWPPYNFAAGNVP